MDRGIPGVKIQDNGTENEEECKKVLDAETSKKRCEARETKEKIVHKMRAARWI